MAMQAGSNSGSGPVPDINVTPLIDVLLVLLIIFMVIVPTLPHGLDSAIPQGHAEMQAAESPTRLSVLSGAGGALVYKVGTSVVPADGLLSVLRETLASRVDRTMVLAADRSLSYEQVAQAMGTGHQAGAERIVFERLVPRLVP